MQEDPELSYVSAVDADLTFQPKISKKSQQIMAESRGESGGAGFLDRLGDDLRRRETKIKVSYCDLYLHQSMNLDPYRAFCIT